MSSFSRKQNVYNAEGHVIFLSVLKFAAWQMQNVKFCFVKPKKLYINMSYKVVYIREIVMV